MGLQEAEPVGKVYSYVYHVQFRKLKLLLCCQLISSF